MISQKRLKEILCYDQETGIFTWRISPSRRTKAGDEAGSLTNKGYLRIRFERVNYYAHRLAWLYVYGVVPRYTIDHINRVVADNRIHNLQDVTMQVNANNKSLRKDSTSKEKCIFFIKKHNSFSVEVRRNKQRYYIGYFNNICDAVIARDLFIENNKSISKI